jgi:hypothetical protein
MVGNRRVYTFGQALDRTSNRNHVGVIRARGSIRFPARNHTLETNLQVNRPACTQPVTESNEVMRLGLLERGEYARRELIAVGMGPPAGPVPEYWTKPECYESGKLKTATEAMMYSQSREDTDLHARVVGDGEESDAGDSDADGMEADATDADEKDDGVVVPTPRLGDADPVVAADIGHDRGPGHALLWCRNQLRLGEVRALLEVSREQLRLHGLWNRVRVNELSLQDRQFYENQTVGGGGPDSPVIYIGHLGHPNHYVLVEPAAPGTAVVPITVLPDGFRTGTPLVTLTWQGGQTFVGRVHDHGALSFGRLGPEAMDTDDGVTDGDRGLARLTSTIGIVGYNCCSWTHMLIAIWRMGLQSQDEFMASIEYPARGDHGIMTMWHPLLKRRVYRRSVIGALARATFEGKVSTNRVVRYTSPASGVPRTSNSNRNLDRDSWAISIFDDVAVKFEIDGVGGAAPVMEAAFGRVFRIHRQTTTGWIEYERAVDLSPTSLQRPRNLFVTLHYYTKVDGSDPPRFVYGLADYTPI